MRMVRKVFFARLQSISAGSKSISIAAMFISDLAGTTTIFGNGLFRGRVWIKVCHSQYRGPGRASDQPSILRIC